MNEKIKTLIVDDDEGVREILGKFLAPEGYEIFKAENGQDGLEVFQRESPHITLLDLRMPVMDGHEFLEAVQPTPESPFLVIVLTGHDTKEEIERCFELGCCAFMKKPPDLFEVRRVVKGCVDLKFGDGSESSSNE